jgi:hypothetical protein
LLDDAHERAIPALVTADLAALLLRQVPALGAEADALLHVADRGCERLGLVLRHAEEMEGEPVRGSRADPGESRQLRDEVLDGR